MFAIVTASIVGLVGLYMVVTLSKDEMEGMLGDSGNQARYSEDIELAEIESEMVDFD